MARYSLRVLDMLSAANPGNSISCLASTQARSPLPPHTPAATLVTFFSKKYPHETEHVIIDKMGLDSANHEIGSRFREKQHFNAVLGRHRRLPLQQGLRSEERRVGKEGGSR